ncbi:hypothetical protein Ddye_023243 [Dipteronia dyeriana]|uniref:Uncharacterized protein n=1 Tax=Dipteronia dyeriana TaxID=168575 RepID=A0AAD9TSK0_9ROSI|nr:hypothetical protein Ddye_023243 [Dipteronia dyeriana]
MVGGRKWKQVATVGGRPSKKRRQTSVVPSVNGKGKGELITEFPNLEDPERWALFSRRTIWPERGIYMTIFGNTFIPDTVNTMQWIRYVMTPNMAAQELVREFYYAMVPYQFLQRVPMIVQGRPVQITSHGINQWLDTPTDLSHLVDGLPKNEHFEPWNWELAADLRLDGDLAWNDHRYPLLHSQLKLDEGFWGGHSTKGHLPFPYLITHFCEVTGINFHGGGWTMFPPMTDMGKQVYNDLAKHRGAKLLRDQGDECALEDDPNDSDYNAEVDTDVVEDDTGPMIDRMLRAIQDMSLMIKVNHRTYMDQFTYIHDRMDDFQKGLGDAGIIIPVMGLRPTEHSANGSRGSFEQAPPAPTMPPQDP